ncbi:helix-turn-helix domain-containing protein [Aestuariibius sp. 2305UL40-4]|uniref:helix-turn-helix domain-containing protein n=1 Tax=Aestuariibius violaceus TaxID=3234132 RepID=UPI00398E46B5
MTFFKQISWNAADANHLVLPDAQGQMTFQAFQGGAMLTTSSIEVSEPTEIAFPHDVSNIHISAQYFLSGEAEIVMGNGARAHWAPDGASVIRSDTPGFRLRLKVGQTLRHVCVGICRNALMPQLTGALSPRLEATLKVGSAIDIAVPVPPDRAVRETAQELYRQHLVQGIGRMKAESLALGFYAEMLGRFSGLDPRDPVSSHTNGSKIEPWQAKAIHALKAELDRSPWVTFAPGEMFERYAMGDQMARRVFQAEFGVSMASYMRSMTLLHARHALMTGTVSVKQVSFDSGYTHTGNFTRAYRQEFGENPSETRRRNSRH